MDHRTSPVRFVREEVVDILAEALWSLICAGRWPSTRGNGARLPATVSTAAGQARHAPPPPRAPCGATGAPWRCSQGTLARPG
jgi:hypothetical protein